MLKTSLVVVVIVLCGLAFNVKSDDNCPDRAALNKVDAWVHPTLNSRGQAYTSININVLEAVRMIDVTKANVSVLCDGMIRMFPQLEYLTLINVNLSLIQPEAFQQVPKLRTLSFAVNGLTQISANQLKNLPNLRSLSFASNKITSIDSDAFAHLKRLEKIYLDRNDLFEISGEWFTTNSQLKLIDLSFNKISKVQDNAFTLLQPDSVLEIRLKSNMIEVIDDEPINYEAARHDFDEPYLTLHLERNRLKSIPIGFLKHLENFHSSLTLNNNYIECIPNEVLEHLKTSTTNLTILNNPISCDCLNNIDRFVAFNEPRASFTYNNSFSCDLLVPGFT